jgi:hypothetical protein
MSDRANSTGMNRAPLPSEGDRELARVLALLEADDAGAITIAAFRERGIRVPAQAVYTLQLAGYAIDRVSCTGPDGHRTLGYRLHRAPQRSPDGIFAPKQTNHQGG